MGHLPTPVELLPNLGARLGLELYVKRDDCTGTAFGGNKVRQLEFYLGAAQAQGATVVLITGAVQSNFVRTAAAMAAKLGMGCHIQLEDRVPIASEAYANNGNVLLDRILGASIHSYPDGEDDAGADANLGRIADELRQNGDIPYVIHLGADHPPIGALGYIDAARELVTQSARFPAFDAIIVATGSGLTHAGLLFGLRSSDVSTPVLGMCVRRRATAQTNRLKQRLEALAELVGAANPVADGDIITDDVALGPGYGRLSDQTREAIALTAQTEGLFLDPVYTGKVMAGLITLAPNWQGKRILFWHTGGQPALFGYGDQLLTPGPVNPSGHAGGWE